MQQHISQSTQTNISMEFRTEIDLYTFLGEEKRNINLPRRYSFCNGDSNDIVHLASARTSCASSTVPFSLWAMSPETPWARSPLHISPSTPLPYQCLASLHRSEGHIFSITITRDIIFTGSSSSRIYAWKQSDCREVGYIKATHGDVRAMLAIGKVLITAHGDLKIRVWDVLSESQRFQPKKLVTLPQKRPFFLYPKRKSNSLHKETISCLAYNIKERLLYTGSWDRTVRVWRISGRRHIDSFIAHDGHVNAIVINQEDGCVFTCSSDGTVKIWRSVFGEGSHMLTMTLKFQPSPVNALALSQTPCGCFLYSGSSDGLINFWEKEKMSGRYNHAGFLQGHYFSVLCLVTLEDLILSGSEDATVRVWRREEGNAFHSCICVVDGHHGPVKSLAATVARGDEIGKSRSLLVFSASLDQSLKVWRVEVCAGEKDVNSSDKTDGNDKLLGALECNMSPVLSPSWVEKKIQSFNF